MLLTRQDIAERLQVSAHRAGDYMQQMERVRLPGGRIRVTEKALDAWIRQHTEQPPVAQTKRMRQTTLVADWRDALGPANKKSPA